MRKVIFYVFMVLLLSGFVTQSDQYQSRIRVFSKGEVLKFRLHYGFITAGEAIVKVTPELYKVNNKICYKFDVEGKSTGMFRKMMYIQDRWLSYVDTTTLLPQLAYREVKESNYRLWDRTSFGQEVDNVKVYPKR